MEATLTNPEQITVSAAARLLGCSESQVRRLSDLGEIPTMRVGRMRTFRRADVDQVRARRSMRAAQR